MTREVVTNDAGNRAQLLDELKKKRDAAARYPATGNRKLPKIWSSPDLKSAGNPIREIGKNEHEF